MTLATDTYSHPLEIFSAVGVSSRITRRHAKRRNSWDFPVSRGIKAPRIRKATVDLRLGSGPDFNEVIVAAAIEDESADGEIYEQLEVRLSFSVVKAIIAKIVEHVESVQN